MGGDVISLFVRCLTSFEGIPALFLWVCIFINMEENGIYFFGTIIILIAFIVGYSIGKQDERKK